MTATPFGRGACRSAVTCAEPWRSCQVSGAHWPKVQSSLASWVPFDRAGEADHVAHLGRQIGPELQHPHGKCPALAVPDHRDRAAGEPGDLADRHDDVLRGDREVTQAVVGELDRAGGEAVALQGRLVAPRPGLLVLLPGAVDQEDDAPRLAQPGPVGALGRGAQPTERHGQHGAAVPGRRAARWRWRVGRGGRTEPVGRDERGHVPARQRARSRVMVGSTRRTLARGLRGRGGGSCAPVLDQNENVF